MDIQRAGEVRPPIHLLAAESDMVASLALQMEHRFPVVAAMLLEEIERAELHDAGTLPDTAVTIGSEVDFIDEKTSQIRSVEIVMPAMANIAEGRISILTPMVRSLRTDSRTIDRLADLDGHERRIRILRVRQPAADNRSGAA